MAFGYGGLTPSRRRKVIGWIWLFILIPALVIELFCGWIWTVNIIVLMISCTNNFIKHVLFRQTTIERYFKRFVLEQIIDWTVTFDIVFIAIQGWDIGKLPWLINGEYAISHVRLQIIFIFVIVDICNCSHSNRAALRPRLHRAVGRARLVRPLPQEASRRRGQLQKPRQDVQARERMFDSFFVLLV